MESPNGCHYAIINTAVSPVEAYGEVAGQVSHPTINGGTPFTVLTQITNINRPMAPVGDSGGSDTADDFDAHIHLYSFQNNPVAADFNSGFPAGYNSTFFRNPKNPLQFLQDAANRPIYLLTFQNTNLVYPGSSRSSFRVRAAMNGETGGGPYSVSMDLDAVELFLKTKYEPFSGFQYYKGSTVESKFLYGGRLNTTRYPSMNFPTHNTGTNALDIAKGVVSNVDQVGTLDRTGVDPYAYANQPYDEFYFSDFFSRIHKNDNYGGTNATFAQINDDARYSDGEYDYYVRATTADEQSHVSAFQTLILDNFRPYIKEIIIRKENASGAMIYRAFWQWNGSQLTLFKENYNDAGPTDNIWIKVISSEPLKFSVAQPIAINIPSVDGTTYRTLTPVSGTNEKEFVITYAPIATSGVRAINLVGIDYSDNQLERMTTSPTTIPIRQGSGNNWLPAANPGIDQNHSFNSGSGTCTPPPGGRIKTGECLIANFDTNVRQALPGSPIVFTSLSSGEGTLQYSWNFGSGASPATASTAGPHNVAYSSTGNKTISLTVTDANGQITNTKTNYISISQNPSSADFTASATSGVQPLVVNFSPTYTGTATSWSWSFPGGSPSSSTAQNPSVTYSGSGSYDVTLTINGTASIHKAGYINVGAASPISVSIAYCDNYYFTGCNNSFKQHDGVYFSADVSGGSPFYNYLWNFGDGSTSTSVEPLHSYATSGSFSVSLTVTDTRGVVATASTSVSIASLTPQITAWWNTSDTFISAGEGPVTFSDATTSNIDLTYAEYYWDFGDGAFPRYAYTKGPHQVCYNNFTPSKNVYLRIHDPVTYTTDDLYAANHVYVAASNVGQCHTTAPVWKPTPGAASGGAVQACLYPNEFVGIKNGRLTSLTCVNNTSVKACAFNPAEPCFPDTWYGSHGDPSLRQENSNSFRIWSRSWYDPNTGSNGTSSEGIFYQHVQNFKAGKRYVFTFYAKVSDFEIINGNGASIVDHFRVSLTSGLVPYTQCDNINPTTISYFPPSYTFSMHELGSFDYAINTSSWKCYEVYFYPPNNNFNQIWFYPEVEKAWLNQTTGGAKSVWMLIDDFSLRVTQENQNCPPDIIVDNTTVANTVGAGITITTTGTVTIPAGSNKLYRAGESVRLLPGFTAAVGSAFNAIIGQCTSSAGREGIDPEIKEFDNYKLDYNRQVTGFEGEPEPETLQETIAGDVFEVFPNPADQTIIIKYKDQHAADLKISILNVLGVNVYSAQMGFVDEIVIDVSGYSSGLYLIRVDSPKGISLKEFIKK